MIFSLLHLVLTGRALWRCVAYRWVFGAIGAAVRMALLLRGVLFAITSLSIVMLPGLTLRRAATPISPMAFIVSLAGPLVTFLVLAAAWTRYQNVPAAREAELQKPFAAWLPVGIVDAMYVVLAVTSALVSRD